MASPVTEPSPAVEKPVANSTEEGEAPKAIVNLDSNGEHLLQSPWTFWFARKINAKSHPSPTNYAEHLQKIASFNTVESFYRTYVYIARPQDLPKESVFHMFKGDVVPMWESFPNGGCWIIKINKKHPQLALIWEELVVYSIGETFEEPDIVGVVLSIRQKEYILQIWNSDSNNNALRIRVCDKLKYYLRLDPNTPIEYKSNSASLRSNEKSSHRNGKIVAPAKDKKKKKKANKQNAANAAAAATAAPHATPAPATTPAADSSASASPAPAPAPAATPSSGTA